MLCALCVLVVATRVACGGTATLFRQYEYEEEVYLSLDGTATVYVNSSLAALNALRGTSFDTSPAARVDTAAVRAYYSTPATRVVRVSQSRRNNRRFVHVRLDVDDVTQARRGRAVRLVDVSVHARRRSVSATCRPSAPPRARTSATSGWNGSEIVAFRLHLPSKIRYHNTKRDVGRGNILVWEQSLADRLRGVPVVYDAGDGALDARMDAQSILYTTLWLFGATFVVVAIVFGGVIWWVMRRGGREKQRVE